ncbi:MAG: 16S rRNA (uracil(1498)-N(3))-methyltransferase [bacterium]|nr:16S rRNA (uracil(1498)-N(3))-methyltransferase [bacterium]
MNLILLNDEDFLTDASNIVRIKGRRLEHARKVFNASAGDELAVGELNGNMGSGIVTAITKESLEMKVSLNSPPPSPLPVTLVLALPRPKMLSRIFQAVSSMGVKKIYIINSWRVEKSFWESPKLEDEAMREQLILGLEQGKDTMLPEIHMRRLFKPFVREELPGIINGSLPLVAHPAADEAFTWQVKGPVTLAIGPEGGFISREIETFEEIGFKRVTLGERILRVETAVPALLSRFL